MAAPKLAPCPREIVVTITIVNGQITVSPDPFHVSKRRNEEVVWFYNNGSFEVDFVESPFNDTQFTDQLPVSGLVRRNVLPSKTKHYKYTVTIGAYSSDPDGQVDD